MDNRDNSTADDGHNDDCTAGFSVALIFNSVKGSSIDGGPAWSEEARCEDRGIHCCHVRNGDNPDESQNASNRVADQDKILIELGHEDICDELADEEGGEGPDHIVRCGTFVDGVVEVEGKTDGE